MAAAVPTIEPREVRAGDSATWTKSLADYSYNDGWRLTYYLRGPKSLTITPTQDGSGAGFSATITAAQSAELPAGQYKLFPRVELGTEVVSFDEISVEVLENPARIGEGQDLRSHAQKMFDAYKNATLSAGGERMIQSYTIFGERSVTMVSESEWQKGYAFWEDRVNMERRREDFNQGKRPGIRMRFVRAQ